MVEIFGGGSYGKLKAWVTSKISTHTAIASAHHTKYTDAEVDTIVAAHTAIASAHHTKYTDAEVDTIVAAHTAIASAHHTKYTDAEVDTIVAAHTAIASAHHTKYLDAEAVSAMGAKGDANPLHHDKYTDGEVDAILSVHTALASAHHTKYTDAEVDTIVAAHTAIASAHHTKYTDAEAVSAVSTADDYVKNDADDTITLNDNTVIKFANNLGADGPGIEIAGASGKYPIFGLDAAAKAKTTFQAASRFWWTIWPYGDSEYIFHLCWSDQTYPTLGTTIPLMEVRKTEVDWYDLKMKDWKNHAATALSGTKKLIEIDIGGSSYYFEVYPTKA